MSYQALQVGSQIRQFRELLNKIDHDLKNVESCYGMAGELQAAGRNAQYDATEHWREFSAEVREKLFALLAIIQREATDE